MTTRQKRIVIVLVFILLLLVIFYFLPYFKQSFSPVTQVEKSKPLTNQEIQSLLDKMAPARSSPTGTKSGLTAQQQSLLNAMAPASTSKSSAPKSSKSYQYAPPPPPSEDIQNLLNTMAPPKS